MANLVEGGDSFAKDAKKAMNRLADDNAGDNEQHLDTANAQQALSAFAASPEKNNLDSDLEKKYQAQRQKELQKVAVNKEDIAFLVAEMEITETKALEILREQGGNLQTALHHLLRISGE